MFHWNILKSNTERQYCALKYNLKGSIIHVEACVKQVKIIYRRCMQMQQKGV